ncbi:hypothetical protein DFH06DRAFT_1470905 [Mycena polygramma]|nr:hypothetical protein DFH06DRAFT_1470905 [Mycena polygramma]
MPTGNFVPQIHEDKAEDMGNVSLGVLFGQKNRRKHGELQLISACSASVLLPSARVEVKRLLRSGSRTAVLIEQCGLESPRSSRQRMHGDVVHPHIAATIASCGSGFRSRGAWRHGFAKDDHAHVHTLYSLWRSVLPAASPSRSDSIEHTTERTLARKL